MFLEVGGVVSSALVRTHRSSYVREGLFICYFDAQIWKQLLIGWDEPAIPLFSLWCNGEGKIHCKWTEVTYFYGATEGKISERVIKLVLYNHSLIAISMGSCINFRDSYIINLKCEWIYASPKWKIKGNALFLYLGETVPTGTLSTPWMFSPYFTLAPYRSKSPQ